MELIALSPPLSLSLSPFPSPLHGAFPQSSQPINPSIQLYSPDSELKPPLLHPVTLLNNENHPTYLPNYLLSPSHPTKQNQPQNPAFLLSIFFFGLFSLFATTITAQDIPGGG
jgi:hypothetical protein